MCTRSAFVSLGIAVLAVTFSAPNTFAANNAATAAPAPTPIASAARAAAAKPRPDQAKVYTNDDLGWSSATAQPSVSAPSQPAGTANAETAPAPLSAEQDPQWYAQQVTLLQADLAAVQNQETQLRLYRANKKELPTGLVISAPVEGITTDGLIATLNARSAEITQRLDDLANLARVNGLPPGVVNQVSLPEEAPNTPDAVVAQYQQASDQLAQTQAALADMQQQAAARGITLLPYNPANGGNLTTDLTDRLNAQASALQNNLNSVEDDARALNVPPGDLR